MLDTMLATHAALRQFPQLQLEVTRALETQLTDGEECHHLWTARYTVRLDHTQKIPGIKLIREALQIGLKQAKELWEVAATLEGKEPYNTSGT